MPARKKSVTQAQGKTLEAQLWDAADKMRGAVPPTDYQHVCLGLVFLRYLSAAFARKHAELLETPHADAEDPEEYQSDNVFWVPEEARWSTLQSHARASDIGKRLDDAMRAIKRDNDTIKGVLSKNYACLCLDNRRLGELIDVIATIEPAAASGGDLLGRVYDWSGATQTAACSPQGERVGVHQFYTQSCVVRCLVEMLATYKGRIYDLACASGVRFVQSEKFIEFHGGNRRFCQESAANFSLN